MSKRTTFIVAICLLLALGLKACRGREFQTLPDGVASVRIGSYFDHGRWTVTVKNKYGSASDTMFAVGDNPRSNIYATPSGQLVVIGKGGEEVFFRAASDREPAALNGEQAKLRDHNSSSWYYIGVIIDGKLSYSAECIPLMGEGRSPYRKQFQSEHAC